MHAKLKQTLILSLVIIGLCAIVALGACSLFPPDGATKYSVAYDSGAEDATGKIPTAQSYEKGAEVTLLPSTTFEREGYVFTGWNDGNATYDAGEIFTMPAHDVTFTAQWSEESQVGDSSTTVTATEVKFESGNLVFKGIAGGGVKTLVAYLYDTNENIQSYKATANIGADRTFTVSIGLSQLTAESGNWYYLMVSVNGGAKLKVQYNKYNQNEIYDYGNRTYKWEYYEGIAVSYSNKVVVVKSYEMEMDSVTVRAGSDGHVYLSVSGTYSGYTEQDFSMDMQLQANPWTVYKKAVTVNLKNDTFTVKMDISDAVANSNGQFYTIHLIVDGNSVNVGCKNDPWIVETSATDANKIYKLKSDYIGWGDDKYVMKVTVQSATSKISQTDYLKVNGLDVKKNYGSGATVMLRGANAGGYFVSEQWMTAVNYKDYKTASEILVNRPGFGYDTMQDLWAYYRSYMWTDADFKNCADMGMTVIRLPFTYMNVDYKQNGNYDFSALDDFVRGASKHGIYTILDLHGAYGSQNGQDHSGEVIDRANQVDFYTNSEKRAKTVALWKALAEHYKNNPAVAGFDLLNEPGVKGAVTGKTQWDFYDEMYKAIRAIDQDRIIIFESCWTGSDLPHPSQYNWENCMYSFHHYVGETDASGKAYSLDQLKEKMWERVDDLNKKNFGIPLYMGEFTCYSNGDFWEYTLNLFNEYGWHWTSWSYKTSWNMGGWGIYYNWANSPDLEKDTIADIKDKWRGISSAYAEETKFGSKSLKDIIKQALTNG